MRTPDSTQRAFQASQKASGAPGGANARTNKQNFSPFYRTLSPTGVAAKKTYILILIDSDSDTEFTFQMRFSMVPFGIIDTMTQ